MLYSWCPIYILFTVREISKVLVNVVPSSLSWEHWLAMRVGEVKTILTRLKDLANLVMVTVLTFRF